MTLKHDMKVYYEAFPDAMKHCDWCNRKFRTVAGLRTHALRMHPAETAPNRKPKCSRCGDTGWLGGDDEAAAREELKRLHGKACYGIQLFVMEEVTDARSPYFPGGLVPNAGSSHG